MSTIFFVHLQKTGGTSINHAARECFSPSRVLMLYGKSSQWTSPAATAIMSDPSRNRWQRLGALSDYIVENDIAFFSSHLSAVYLRCFEPARAFTILREPVNRVISQYFFFRKMRRTDESLAEFIERPEHQNVQAKALRGIDLKALAAVGVVERYEEFLGQLNRRLGLNFPIAHRKRGGFVKELQARLVRPSLKRRIEELNSGDIALFRQALEIMEQADKG